MLALRLAQQLQSAGLAWAPAPGDRFVVAGREMDDDVFVVSDMTVEVHDLPHERVIGFNGTTEWALDSVALHEAVWLPREEQLRERLAGEFLRLEAGDDGWTVVVRSRGGESRFCEQDAEDAYASALLDVLARD